MRVFVLSRFFPLRLRKPPVFEEDEDALDADEDALLAAGDNALVADEDFDEVIPRVCSMDEECESCQ